MTNQKRKPGSAAAKKPQLVAGMADVVPGMTPFWELIFRRLQKYARAFGFSRVETPLLESVAMYENDPKQNPVSFLSADDERLSLRADSLPGIMRAYADKKFPETQKLSKWYYIQQTVQYGQKQKTFAPSWQYGLELFGEFSALVEVQLIAALWKLFSSLGFEGLTLEINNIGKNSERKDYEQALSAYLQTKKYELCNECVAAIEEQPMQVFRCANPSCQSVAADAPQAIDHLSEECHRHFTHVLETLDELGVSYLLNPALVGRAGSSETVFAFKSLFNEREFLLGEGSSHQELMKAITGKDISCFGFSGNFEVLQEVLTEMRAEIALESRAEVFLAPLGDLAARKALRLFAELWDANIYVHDAFGDGGVKNQLKLAEGSKAIIALIIGQKEAMDDMVILRDVKSGMQEVFQYERIIDEVKKRLGR